MNKLLQVCNIMGIFCPKEKRYHLASSQLTIHKPCKKASMNVRNHVAFDTEPYDKSKKSGQNRISMFDQQETWPQRDTTAET